MAHRNQVIRNRKTGQEILFLYTASNTAGKFLGMVATFQPQHEPPMPHYHPQQTLDFDVLKGELTALVNGQRTRLQSGDALHIPANQTYALWNGSASGQPAVINCRLRPALDAEFLLETATDLANAEPGEANQLAQLLQKILVARQFSNVFRRCYFPLVLQKIVFLLLTPVAYLVRYRKLQGTTQNCQAKS